MEDQIKTNENTKRINWGIMTVADVTRVKNGAVLNQEGKKLSLEIAEPRGMSFSVISLDPPPLEIDKTIENFKRIELQIPAWLAENEEITIKVRFSEK